MADAPVVHIGENSPEKVALDLLRMVASVERKLLTHREHPDHGHEIATRQWILSTYYECFHVVQGARPK
jgi:hypothetical protein